MKSLLLLFILFIPFSAFAQFELNTDKKGIALLGFDPVSYFDNNPKKGRSSLRYKVQSATYLFSSKKNLNLFSKNPSAYMPQYGGYCSYGARFGKKLEIDPSAYSVIDNKLYLLLNRATHKMWQQETQKNIAIANRVWPSIVDIAPKLLD